MNTEQIPSCRRTFTTRRELDSYVGHKRSPTAGFLGRDVAGCQGLCGERGMTCTPLSSRSYLGRLSCFRVTCAVLEWLTLNRAERWCRRVDFALVPQPPPVTGVRVSRFISIAWLATDGAAVDSGAHKVLPRSVPVPAHSPRNLDLVLSESYTGTCHARADVLRRTMARWRLGSDPVDSGRGTDTKNTGYVIRWTLAANCSVCCQWRYIWVIGPSSTAASLPFVTDVPHHRVTHVLMC